jgi:hypothetical protein
LRIKQTLTFPDVLHCTNLLFYGTSEEGNEVTRVHGVKEIEDIHQVHGHDEMSRIISMHTPRRPHRQIARTYCEGTREEYQAKDGDKIGTPW